jgi:hypothetical protein
VRRCAPSPQPRRRRLAAVPASLLPSSRRCCP